MSTNVKWLITIVLVAILSFCLGHYTNKIDVVNPKQIDSIERVNDSLRQELLNLDKQIQYVDSQHKENVSNIINQSFSSDKEFFTGYLNRFYIHPDSGAVEIN